MMKSSWSSVEAHTICGEEKRREEKREMGLGWVSMRMRKGGRECLLA